MVEIERRFLIDRLPNELPPGVELRQGYVAIDDTVNVRVRSMPERFVLTVKGGSGLERTEVELDIDAARFEALWALSAGRRIRKTRHRIALDGSAGLVVELDVFADALADLMIAEVEFASLEAARTFEPPAWFGREVTEERAWNNASLATRGRPG